MAGDRQDCDRRGADRGGGGLLLLWERDVIKQQLRQGNQNTDEQSKCCIRKAGKDMEKQWLQRRHKGPTIRVHSAEHTIIWSRDMAITVANGRRLEAAHHRWLRRILYVTWRDKITNKVIRERTGQEELGCTIRRKRLTWLGHVARMNMNKRAKQVLN